MPHVIVFPLLIGSMSHGDFKKWQCRPVEFKGQEPSPSIKTWAEKGPRDAATRTDPSVCVHGALPPALFKGFICIPFTVL